MARPAAYDRDEIVAKALKLFWRKGYQATSLKDLEQALDMRPGSIYAAFGSKEGLFAETLDAYAARSTAAFAETMAAAPSPLAGLAAHARALGCLDDSAPSRACMLVKTVLETPDDDPALRRQAEAAIAAIEAAFADGFRAAQEAGEIAPSADPAHLASRLQSQIFGLRAYAQRTDAGPRVAALAEDIAREIEGLANSDDAEA
ncbi:MAG: helix-turn-helix domain-containing protein [Pseudomonadota bacterium]